MVKRLSIKEGKVMPYVLWVLDGDDREWKMYKGVNDAKRFIQEHDHEEFLDELNTQVFPKMTVTHNYIDWVVLPAGEDPKDGGTNKFYGTIMPKYESKIRSRKPAKLREADSYGWVVESYEAYEAYDMACEYFGKDYVDDQIVDTLSDDELASSLAYLFRMWDFREWDKRNEDSDDNEFDEE